jgi:hypothetical protein
VTASLPGSSGLLPRPAAHVRKSYLPDLHKQPHCHELLLPYQIWIVASMVNLRDSSHLAMTLDRT